MDQWTLSNCNTMALNAYEDYQYARKKVVKEQFLFYVVLHRIPSVYFLDNFLKFSKHNYMQLLEKSRSIINTLLLCTFKIFKFVIIII